MRRYPPDYPGLDGQDLTPGGPLESFTSPLPAPNGAGATTALTAAFLAADQIQVDWDTLSCAATDYNLLYGNLADVSTHTLQGAECGIGIGGSHFWDGVPAGDLFFVIVGVDGTGVYESSWGLDGLGAERAGTAPSAMCGANYKIVSESCP